MIVAVFASASHPVSFSLINDYFSYEYKSRANSIFLIGGFFGVVLSSLTTNLDTLLGWKEALIIVSLICLALGLLTILLKEPKRKSLFKSIHMQVDIYNADQLDGSTNDGKV
jgi:MFS family permease